QFVADPLRSRVDGRCDGLVGGRSLRRWWNGAFAVLLCVSLAAAVVTLGFVSGLVRDYHGITAESDRETEALARVTAAVVAEEAASHAFVDYGGANTFQAVDRRVAT